jgi:bis(5'-nucleosidyl)-tetraphosphatase
MTYEISAGILIYRQLKDTREYLLLHYPGGHFDFAKGHIEKGESEREAAIRELKEETGLEKIVWIEGYREKIHYTYRHGEEIMSKDVIFFLARTLQKKITISFEHQGALWLPYDEAYKKLTFENARQLLEKAENLLKRTKIS